MATSRTLILTMAAVCGLSQPAIAQSALNYASGSGTIATIGSGEADLGTNNTIEWSRTVAVAEAEWRSASAFSLGTSVLVGRTAYTFGSALQGSRDLDIDEFSLSVPISFSVGETGRAFIIPGVTYHGESGVSFSDGASYSLIGGVGWQVSPTLFIGPGVGVATSLIEGEDASVFPFLLLDWRFAPSWSLSTGSGFAASRGPGLRLAYNPSSEWEFGLEARLEEYEFRLDDQANAVDGAGREGFTQALLTARYSPNESVSITGFIGAGFGGSLEFFNSAGTRVFDQEFDTVPLVGIAARLAF